MKFRKFGWTRISICQRGLRVAVVVVLLGGFALLSGPRPPARISLLPCGLHALTGLPCPLCGGTRAARAILAGNWDCAVYLNALAFPALILVALLMAALSVEAIFGRDVLSWSAAAGWVARWGPLLIALTIVWWLPHLFLALRTPKPELVDLGNPIAACLRAKLAPAK